MSSNIYKIQKKLRKYIDEERYWHTLGVMYTAASLAMRYDVDIEKAQVAGLLHDCAKCIPNSKKLKLCRQYHLTISETEEQAPYLLHAPLGACIAKEKYDVTDPEILSAITWHTTGKPEMTALEKIIFLADYIEPMRTKASNLPEIRRMAFEDLDLAVYTTLRDTLLYLKDSTSLDKHSVEAYNYYKQIIESREA
ncbi:MAG: bis(5'-nucleosyl)-tetraphosphatase (symmetrical) YqeK [Lachnospiraceae bacterium]|nr:bis(5'-nucleosyl)-tetraphosphatase (symmetrical) YqeK [Lachnospiraceae bacterium]